MSSRAMFRSASVLVAVGALVLSACSGSSDSSAKDDAGTGPSSTIKATAAAPAALKWDEQAAVKFNGDLPAAEPVKVCGADDRRFLGELLGGNPLEFKVPKRLGEVKPVPSQALVSGEVTRVDLGSGDFPFDHTMGSDFNMDVRLDAPFKGVGQEDAKPIDSLHVELAEGQLPHLETAPGPDRVDWEKMSDASRKNFQDGFIPRTGDRVLVMGTWIVDCGHTNFQTELHPMTFMAVARTEGDATVVHTFYNPWRETQLYNPDRAKTTDFDRPGRLDDPTNVPFPKGLVDSVLALAKDTPTTTADGPAQGLASWAVLAPNTVAPVPWKVCAPGATSGAPKVGAAVNARVGVELKVTPGDDGCAQVSVSLDRMTPPVPKDRTCVTTWEFLSEVATEEAGGEEGETAPGEGKQIDLKEEIGKFLPGPVKEKLSPDPVMNCYSPLSGPDLGAARPDKVKVDSSPDALMPFYGTVVVRKAG